MFEELDISVNDVGVVDGSDRRQVMDATARIEAERGSPPGLDPHLLETRKAGSRPVSHRDVLKERTELYFTSRSGRQIPPTSARVHDLQGDTRTTPSSASHHGARATRTEPANPGR